MARSGYSRLTINDVTRVAGVSKVTFYEFFDDKLSAVRAAHEEIFEPYFASITEVCELPHQWPVRVTTAIGDTLAFASTEPARAQLLTVQAVAQSADLAKRVIESTDRLAELLSSGRSLNTAAAELPSLTEKALIGGISAIVYSHLVQDESERLPELKRQLAELTLLPYVGSELAAQIAVEQA
jgi:AcrR family transcriptional regulator